MRRYGFFLLISCSLAACAINRAGDDEAMLIKAAELTKLSTAVEASVRYEAAQSAGLDEAALLQFASRDDPQLLDRFAGLSLRVARGDRHAAVLVCSADGRRALLEDAGCTMAMDRQAWREADSRCEFRLDLATLCAVQPAAAAPRSAPAPAAAPVPAPVASTAPVTEPVRISAPVQDPAHGPVPAHATVSNPAPNLAAPGSVPAAAPVPSELTAPLPVLPPAPAPAPAAVPAAVPADSPADSPPMAAPPETASVVPPVRAAAAPVAATRTLSVPLIEVAGMAWASEIGRDSKRPVAAITQAVSGRRLVLWMSVQGSEVALNQLAASGKLPIRHKWFRETISGIRPEGVARPVDEIEIPAARAELVAKLRQEVRSLGYFNWRTWSAKDKPGPGNWRVTVFYADNTPVLCRTPDGLQPCEYEIEVR